MANEDDNVELYPYLPAVQGNIAVWFKKYGATLDDYHSFEIQSNLLKDDIEDLTKIILEWHLKEGLDSEERAIIAEMQESCRKAQKLLEKIYRRMREITASRLKFKKEKNKDGKWVVYVLFPGKEEWYNFGYMEDGDPEVVEKSFQAHCDWYKSVIVGTD